MSVVVADNVERGGQLPGSIEAESNEVATVLLSAAVDTVVTEKRMQYRSRIGVDIRFELDADSYGVFANVNPVEFRRAISNLVDNAVESIEDRGEVAIGFFRRSGLVGLRVRDTGRGIPPSILARLGRRGETYGKKDGSGLGLHHARTWVEAWGGSVEIDSQVERGTEISVLLPRAASPDWFAPALDVPRGCHVFVLDDDVSIHGI